MEVGMGAPEIREVEIFLVMAEELHFRRAADRLYLSPSRVSQAVRALEDRVGARLFDRTNRWVRLTPLGEKLLDRARPAYAELLGAFEAARDMAGQVTGELRIRALSLSALGPSFDRIQHNFRDRYPNCRVHVFEDRPVEALADLRRGVAELLVTWLPLAEPDLTIGPVLTREDRVLLLSTGHPLVTKGHATVEDLGRYAVADMDDVLPPETRVTVFCPERTPSGRLIERRHRARGATDLLLAVASGEIVHPTVPSFPAHYRHPEVTHVPMHGLPVMESALVWVTARESAAIRAFADEVGSASCA
jgi:DNA-binding transcriptional LysR family regulator